MRNSNKLIHAGIIALAAMLAVCCAGNTDNPAAGNGTTEKAVPANTASIINPWLEIDAQDAEKAAGFKLGIPPGAEKIIYRLLAANNMVEMQFIINGEKWTARTKPAEEYEDISGMYFKWKSETKNNILGLEGKELRTESEGKNILSGLWHDSKKSRMFSLSVSSVKKKNLAPAAIIFGQAAK